MLSITDVALEVVKPRAEPVTPRYDPEWADRAVRLIEECGRVSHKSEGRIRPGSAIPFDRKVAIEWGHESILEHASFTACFIGSRSMSHQLVRHRIAAYCVTGDSQLVAFGKSRRSPKRWTIGQLYQWQNDPKRKGRLRLIRLRSVDNNNLIVPGRIDEIVDTGLQYVFDVKTRCGRAIRCTDNEWFRTDGGWRRLHELKVGDRVQVNGELAYRNEEWLRQHYLNMNMKREDVATLAGVSDAQIGKWIRQFGLQKPKTMYPNRQPGHGVPGMHSDEFRNLLSTRMQAEGNHRWKGNAAGAQAGRKRARGRYMLRDCDCCNSPATHHHHLNENPLDNDHTNVVPLCAVCHHAHHVGQAALAVYSTPIISILAVGVERTYDIKMKTADDSLRNYVVNGFVVHNTQESQRYCDYVEENSGNRLKIIVPPSVGTPVAGSIVSRTETEIRIIGAGDPTCDVVGPSKPLWVYLQRTLDSYRGYLELRDEGVPAEDAREVLPNATKTEVYTTLNLREWRHVFRMRLDKHAQWQIKACVRDIYDYFKEACPMLLEGLRTHSGDAIA